jgi:membrane protease YdiL (CAAX protease family)
VLSAAVVLWAFRCDHADLRWTWSWPSVAIGAVVFLAWMGLERVTATTGAGETLSIGLARLSPVMAGTWLAFRVFGSVVTVPLAEELAFRGYLTRG